MVYSLVNWLLGVCSLPLPLFSSVSPADIISTVQFNHDGEFLATGDKGGRVVIFQRDGTKIRVRVRIKECELTLELGNFFLVSVEILG